METNEENVYLTDDPRQITEFERKFDELKKSSEKFRRRVIPVISMEDVPFCAALMREFVDDKGAIAFEGADRLKGYEISEGYTLSQENLYDVLHKHLSEADEEDETMDTAEESDASTSVETTFKGPFSDLLNCYDHHAETALLQEFYQAVASGQHEPKYMCKDALDLYMKFHSQDNAAQSQNKGVAVQKNKVTSQNLFELLGAITQKTKRHEVAQYFVEKKILQDGMRTFFSRNDAMKYALLGMILQEKKKIQMAIYQFTFRDLAQALIDMHKKGVEVEVVCDKKTFLSRADNVRNISQHGIPVFCWPKNKPKGYQCMHHKFVIFSQNIHDKPLLWNGSFNWTYPAVRSNEENANIIEDEKLFKGYQQKFAKLKEASEEYRQKEDVQICASELPFCAKLVSGLVDEDTGNVNLQDVNQLKQYKFSDGDKELEGDLHTLLCKQYYLKLGEWYDDTPFTVSITELNEADILPLAYGEEDDDFELDLNGYPLKDLSGLENLPELPRIMNIHIGELDMDANKKYLRRLPRDCLIVSDAGHKLAEVYKPKRRSYIVAKATSTPRKRKRTKQ